MKRLLSITVIALTAACAFALNKDPEYLDARKTGALAKLEIHVVDALGNPVPDAQVSVFWGMNFRVDGHYVEGSADANGVFMSEGKTCGDEIVINVSKQGYYSSTKNLCFAKIGAERDVKGGKWLPFGETESVILQAIVNPANLVTMDKLIDVAHTNQWLGFDMQKMDFVRPVGAGKLADWEIMVNWDGLPAWESRHCSVMLRFSPAQNGGNYVGNVAESEFPYPLEAVPNLPFAERDVWIVERDEDIHAGKRPFAKDASLVTRTRCVLDENGEVKTANYGCIRRMKIGPSRRGVALLRLSYVFNPTPNDTNLEDLETAEKSRTFHRQSKSPQGKGR